MKKLFYFLLSFSLSLVSCSDEPEGPSYNWANHLNIRLLTNDGQNLFTVDPELNSLINEEFVVTVKDGTSNVKYLSVIRDLVHSWDDTTYYQEWDYSPEVVPEHYYVWGINNFYIVYSSPNKCYAQLTPTYGYSPHDKISRWNSVCMNAAFYTLTINYSYLVCSYPNSGRTFYITLEWPRGGKVWNFEHVIPADHKGDKMLLNGSELDPKTALTDGNFLDLVIDDETLYQGLRFNGE